MGRSHPDCWTGDSYQHTCHKPSGRTCVDCDQPAGTPWGPYWCPNCDVVRLDWISAGMDEIAAALAGSADDTEPADDTQEADHG